MRPIPEFSPDQIIWSADAPKYDIMAVLDAEVLPKGTVIKLDRLFFEDESKDFINWCEGRGYPVFCDAKIIEIPDKCLEIAQKYLNWRPFMLNIMAGACSTARWSVTDTESAKQIDALARFAEACEKAGTKSCVVTVLTSKTDTLCNQEFCKSASDQVIKYVKLAHLAGITNIVCSPQEATNIRNYPDFKEMEINTPGVRLPDSSKDDQARVTTPHKALRNGSNRLVIGRDLTRGEGDIIERVRANYAKIVDNIKNGDPETPKN